MSLPEVFANTVHNCFNISVDQDSGVYNYESMTVILGTLFQLYSHSPSNATYLNRLRSFDDYMFNHRSQLLQSMGVVKLEAKENAMAAEFADNGMSSFQHMKQCGTLLNGDYTVDQYTSNTGEFVLSILDEDERKQKDRCQEATSAEAAAAPASANRPTTLCCCCLTGFADWQMDDDVAIEHQNAAPTCPYNISLCLLRSRPMMMPDSVLQYKAQIKRMQSILLKLVVWVYPTVADVKGILSASCGNSNNNNNVVNSTSRYIQTVKHLALLVDYTHAAETDNSELKKDNAAEQNILESCVCQQMLRFSQSIREALARGHSPNLILLAFAHAIHKGQEAYLTDTSKLLRACCRLDEHIRYYMMMPVPGEPSTTTRKIGDDEEIDLFLPQFWPFLLDWIERRKRFVDMSVCTIQHQSEMFANYSAIEVHDWLQLSEIRDVPSSEHRKKPSQAKKRSASRDVFDISKILQRRKQQQHQLKIQQTTSTLLDCQILSSTSKNNKSASDRCNDLLIASIFRKVGHSGSSA